VKIARLGTESGARTGVVVGETVRVLDPGVAVLDLLGAAPESREQIAVTGDEVPLAEAVLLAPLEPASLRDFVTFEEHVEGMALGAGAAIPPEWYEAPTFYFSNTASIVGPFDDVAVPPGCAALDFELEVAAVVGRTGRDLAPAAARDHIAGYTVLNDWSARDLQAREMRVLLGPAKGKDFASTLGPWIVTADELEPYSRDDRLHLELEVRVNGTKVGDDTLANMAWSFEEMLAYASRGTQVVAGDVLGSGTCGSGCLAELWGRRGRREPPPLAAGDVVEIRVEGIGEIRNRIVAGAEPVALPAARPSGYRRERSA
jgi:2-keto-4-pentenoate hydratase/2-oxohepta-3-ene-1,7-dioic acid hydratase in catechol pathway